MSYPETRHVAPGRIGRVSAMVFLCQPLPARLRGVEPVQYRTKVLTPLRHTTLMPGGRPTEYRAEFVEIAASMCLNGATDAEVAEELGVSLSAYYLWRAKYPEFLEALRYGKENADDRVERSLYHRAIGFTYPAVKVSFDKDGNPLFARYMEYYPPDTGAAKMWLMNRRPKEWREKNPGSSADEPLYTRTLADFYGGKEPE